VIVEHLWSRADANSGNRWQVAHARNRLNKPRPLRSASVSCSRSEMVRRGSTVRVRQRASAFSLLRHRFSSSGMAPAGFFDVTERPPTSTGRTRVCSTRRGACGRRSGAALASAVARDEVEDTVARLGSVPFIDATCGSPTASGGCSRRQQATPSPQAPARRR
jgi:hypothetical protein